MKYCTKCGKELFDEAVICPGCGCSCEDPAKKTDPDDKKNFGWALLGFLVPVVGLVLFLVWKDSSPLKAKSAGKGALVSVIISVIFSFAISVFSGFLFARSTFSGYESLYQTQEFYDNIYI